MIHIQSDYLIYSLCALVLSSLLSTIFTSLRLTGDAGLPRLINREGQKTKHLLFWQNRWGLLCKTARLLLIPVSLSSFIFFYLALTEDSGLVQSISLFILCIIYMVVARIIPHVLSESYADRISLTVLPLTGILTLILFPVVWPLEYLEKHLLHHAMAKADEEDHPSPEDEIKSLIEETDEEELEEEEREIIRSVFEFGTTITREIMTPRVNMSGLKSTLTVKECIEQVKESRHSRFPVYHENLDDIIGMVHVKDLLRLCGGDDCETPIRQLVKKMQFVPETMPINDLMQLMKTSHSQLALVVDEYGGTEGIVSMEDIIEELVGEIEDEYDLNEKELQRRPDGSVMVQARIPICDLNDELETKIPESNDYDSLGGYMFAALGHIPVVGETIDTHGYTLRVHSATQRKIQVIHMIPHEPND